MKLARGPVHEPYDGPEDSFEGRCPVCGERGRFTREVRFVTEDYRCPSCGSTLRYQGQARAIVRAFARHGAQSIAELVTEPEFRRTAIFEPGTMGPFRRHFRKLENYVASVYDPTADAGTVRAGVACEDLMNLSFASESIDLVITSDIFEHVRHPTVGFSEVYRVLRPGGMHIFTIPGRWPLRDRTIARVDVSGPDDVFVLPPVYHNKQHLVYNDFGRDLLDVLEQIGFVTDPLLFESTSATAASQVTFCSVRPEPGA